MNEMFSLYTEVSIRLTKHLPNRYMLGLILIALRDIHKEIKYMFRDKENTEEKCLFYSTIETKVIDFWKEYEFQFDNSFIDYI